MTVREECHEIVLPKQLNGMVDITTQTISTSATCSIIGNLQTARDSLPTLRHRILVTFVGYLPQQWGDKPSPQRVSFTSRSITTRYILGSLHYRSPCLSLSTLLVHI